MFIDFKKLEAAGFNISTQKDGIHIEPERSNDQLSRQLYNLLEGYIDEVNAEQVMEGVVKKVQVLEIIKVLSD